MGLLEKFADVEIRDETRITDTDKNFCAAHQAAYENAKSMLSELKYFWNDMLDQQQSLLPSTEDAPTLYLLSRGELRISADKINEQIRAAHSVFVRHIISYFNRTYNISISSDEVIGALMPKKPEISRHFDESGEWDAYENTLMNLSFEYKDVLEQIFIRLDGRNLQEQALHELLEKCHQAAWNSYHKRSEYVRKKAILQFSFYACSHSSGYSYESWKLSEKLKNVLYGIAHYETDSFTHIPGALSKVINAYDLRNDFFEFPACKKVQSIRLFKNGRADIRFVKEEYAQQFVEKYLGTAH